MAQFGNYLTYNGHSSAEFNLALASFESVDSYESGMSREVQRSDLNRYRYKPNHFGMVYSDVLTFEVSFVKDICSEDVGDDVFFTRSEYRNIVQWLTEPEYPALLHVNESNAFADLDVYYFGVFSNIENKSAGDIYGITATFTCDSPFGWSEEKTLSFSGTEVKSVTVDSDVVYTYPIITVTPSSASEITIANMTENLSFSFTPSFSRGTITIDCNKLTIKDRYGSKIYLTDLGISDPADVYWLRLLRGSNTISVSGDANVTIKYREAMKVGAY